MADDGHLTAAELVEEQLHCGCLGCGVQLVDASVSRYHAEIRAKGEGFAVVDLGSTNGTKVNGVRVTERDLRDDDELSFGNVRVRFSAS